MFRWWLVMMFCRRRRKEEQPALGVGLVRIVPIENEQVGPLLAHQRIGCPVRCIRISLMFRFKCSVSRLGPELKQC
jgi:hypothetical protein